MATSGIEWGWRVRCSAPDCPEVHMQWADRDGPPPLHCTGQGWFFHSSKNGPVQRGHSTPRSYIAYCPDHAEPLKEWSATHQAWKNARRSFGRQRAQEIKPTFWDAVLSVFGSAYHRQVGMSVEEWERLNPEPLPPWRS